MSAAEQKRAAAPPTASWIDAIGLRSHGALMRVIHEAHGLSAGSIIEMITDDASAETEVRAWALRSGHVIDDVMRAGDLCHFIVRIGAGLAGPPAFDPERQPRVR